MNIFELIASDPAGYQRVSNDLGNYKHHWTLFKQLVAELLAIHSDNVDFLVSRMTTVWRSIVQSSPEIIGMFLDYYTYEVDKLLSGTLQKKLEEIGLQRFGLALQLYAKMQTILQLEYVHSKFIKTFDDQSGTYQQGLHAKIGTVLAKEGLKEKLSAVLLHAYHQNCITIFREDIIDFDQKTKDYVIEQCKGAQQKPVQLAKVKYILDGLGTLGLLGECFEPTYYMLNADNEKFIENCADLSSNTEFLTRCLNYQRTFQKSFLKHLKSTQTESFFGEYLALLDGNSYFLCGKFCCKNILNIVLDFPESYATLMSLKKCLDHTNLLNEVASSLQCGISKRLLIPGVITQNILNQYINMLKVLQILDPQGIIFEQITAPIKNYLLRRNDTLRCIISHLTEDVSNYSELSREVVKIPSREYIDQNSSEEDENAAKHWQILPVHESKTKVRVKYQEIDLVTVLVGLYGSQEAFICEYQNMMAEKLMSVRDYNIEEEIKNIQLLKMRFGESPLQTCNIIVKDVKDSKRNDNVIHREQANKLVDEAQLSLLQMNCLTVSKGYWPINYETNINFQLPSEFKRVFEEYALAFTKIKAMRKILFHYNLGYVVLHLKFDNTEVTFKCLPVQAVMITYFDEDRMREGQIQSGISSEDLSAQLHIPQNIVKQKMSFWVHQGVVKEIRMPKTSLSLKRMNSMEDSEVIYYKPVKVYTNEVGEDIDEDADSALLKESITMESHLRHIIECLIISILNINGPKSAEKIHLLLKTVYKTDLDYSYGEAQTVQILKKMHLRKKIHFNGETYSSKLQ